MRVVWACASSVTLVNALYFSLSMIRLSVEWKRNGKTSSSCLFNTRTLELVFYQLWTIYRLGWAKLGNLNAVGTGVNEGLDCRVGWTDNIAMLYLFLPQFECTQMLLNSHLLSNFVLSEATQLLEKNITSTVHGIASWIYYMCDFASCLWRDFFENSRCLFRQKKNRRGVSISRLTFTLLYRDWLCSNSRKNRQFTLSFSFR